MALKQNNKYNNGTEQSKNWPTNKSELQLPELQQRHYCITVRKG